MFLVFFIFLSGRILGGKGSFSRTLRTVGFAYTFKVYLVLAFIPVISGITKFLVLAISLVAFWIAGVQAHKLRGWRSLIFPLLVVAVVVISLVVIDVLVGGAAFTIDSMLQDLGVAP